jgi:hypothetical protein
VVLSKRRANPRSGGTKTVGAGVCTGKTAGLYRIAAMMLDPTPDVFYRSEYHQVEGANCSNHQGSINAGVFASSSEEANPGNGREKQNS